MGNIYLVRPYGENSNCSKCKGTGWLQVQVGEDEYQAVACDAPDCLQEGYEAYRRGEPFILKAGVPTKPKTFEGFVQVPGAEEAYKAARAFSEGEADFIWLLIYGGTGNGKSHLLEAVTRTLIKRGISAVLYHTPDILNKLRASISTNTYGDELLAIQNIGTLILDDLKARKDKPWEMDTLEDILTYRWREVLPTVVATNWDLDELPERLVSRFFREEDGGKAIHNSAGDFSRLKGGK